MKIQVTNSGNHAHIRAVARCPACGNEAVFEPVGEHDYIVAPGIVCGQRRCPNPQCKNHLFVVFKNSELIKCYPPIRLDFNSENIPKQIVKTFEEALDCHANECFVASAIMVRRTLEEICVDRGATGNNLKEKIKDLQSKIVLPKELLAAMDELRLLGNDAAHIKAKEYENISNKELSVAFEFTKEILKGIYQYSSLLAKMRALKK